ncbi:MAG: phage portal protein [Pseudomonadota bacterium]
MGFIRGFKRRRTADPEVAQKASAAGHLTVQLGQNQPQFTPRRYDRLADEGYLKNVIVYRCIRLIAQNVAAVPWQVKQGRGPHKTVLEDHPLAALLKRPNPTQSYAEFVESVCGFMLIAGNSYIEAVAPEDAAPRELWVLRPDRMQVIPGKQGIPKAYRYSVDGQYLDYPVDAVTGKTPLLHLKAFHPLNDWYGMSPLEAAAYSIDQHNEAAKWNTGLLQSSGRPSGALIYKPGGEGQDSLTDEHRQTLKAELEAYYQGGNNAGRPMVLEGGLDWREMALSPKDMDWTAGKDLAAREIALAFNVPPQLVGIEGSLTYANFEQARLAFYDDAVLPLMDHIRDELNNWLAPVFGPDISLDYNRNAIEALAPRREKIWNRVKDADFMTLNEKRASLGLSPLKEAAADRLAESSEKRGP